MIVKHISLLCKKKRQNRWGFCRLRDTGDGNRTRVSCLGSTRPTIERRPLGVSAEILSWRVELVKGKKINLEKISN